MHAYAITMPRSKKIVVNHHRAHENLCASPTKKACSPPLRQLAPTVTLPFKGFKKSQKGFRSPLKRTVLVSAESDIAPFTRLAGRIAQMGRTKTERRCITAGACPEVQGHNICITIMPMQWTWK
jgi:hypothetical protein